MAVDLGGLKMYLNTGRFKHNWILSKILLEADLCKMDAGAIFDKYESHWTRVDTVDSEHVCFPELSWLSQILCKYCGTQQEHTLSATKNGCNIKGILQFISQYYLKRTQENLQRLLE